VNVTDIVQLAPTPTLLPHVLVWPKSETLVPVTPMLAIVRTAVPGFESVIVLAALDVPTFWLLNARLGGLSEACATTPVPLRAAA
jgi:hypothetical protein